VLCVRALAAGAVPNAGERVMIDNSPRYIKQLGLIRESPCGARLRKYVHALVQGAESAPVCTRCTRSGFLTCGRMLGSGVVADSGAHMRGRREGRCEPES
jgi:hypothetical protein